MLTIRPRTLAMVLAAAAAGIAPISCTSAPNASASPRAVARPATAMRGLFVTRWDFQSPQDVTRIVEQARDAGFTDIFWQVRGQSDAFYQSDLEPRGEIPGADPTDFDPLAEAIQRAGASGLRLHAWINVLPLWHGPVPPRNRTHLRTAHPEWRLTDPDGIPVRTRDGYELLNPVRPEVRAHLASVVADIVSRYPIDGVCFDALRLPAGPGDAVSRRLFATENAEALGAGEDRSIVMDRWIDDSMERLVSGLATAARDARPALPVSIVISGASPQLAAAQHQRGAEWAASRLCDRLIVLSTADTPETTARVESDWSAALGKTATLVTAAIVPSAGVDPARFEAQLDAITARQDAILFGYASIFESADLAVPRDVRAVAVRAARRDAVVRRWAPAPKPAEPAPRLDEVKGVPPKAAEKQDGPAQDEPPADRKPADEPAPAEDESGGGEG
jgi:uncharacterized lipoprotein YddW (UPF0748 family)